MTGKSKRLNEDLIRHAYEGVIEALARLAAFADSQVFRGETAVDRTQIRLAIDDLIRLSVHIRRLLVATNSIELAKQCDIALEKGYVNIDEYKFIRTGEVFDLWKMFGTIIHSESISIFRRHFELFIERADPNSDEFFQSIALVHKKNGNFSPRLFVKSDRSHAFVCVRDVIDLTANAVLAEVVDRCADRQLFLDPDAFG